MSEGYYRIIAAEKQERQSQTKVSEDFVFNKCLCYTSRPAKAGERSKMKYTPQQREELLRLFDARTCSIHEFAIQHKVSLCALYKWQKKRGKLQNFNVSIRDVQHMRSRIKLLEEAMVDPQGFEPQQAESESAVLPLHHGSIPSSPFRLAGSTGLEPATPGSTVQCANQLRHNPVAPKSDAQYIKNSRSSSRGS